ncbi:D-lactate dehydrogenase [cytochrome] 2, mitochondrial [Smittium mucronatum]|uniref:D-lactate dehydrogenase [cytochrome] 2, mitochondrial n=1 Tax=Smittium mucronatum TaxID=133383 RepID=A0A1R0H675_9FUNG|nr:D-lactate dehydrogenase [cytochrome] 2, mitochondrial [Smittium mucronatum]
MLVNHFSKGLKANLLKYASSNSNQAISTRHFSHVRDTNALRSFALPKISLSSLPISTSARSSSTLLSASYSKRFMSHIAPRESKFKKLEISDVKYFESFMPKERVYATSEIGGNLEPKDLEGFNSDWLEKYHGNSHLVLFPTNANEVSKILKYCNEKLIAVVPQGGNTALVGSSVPVYDEVILSLSKMNKVRSLDKDSGALVCDSGCVLEELDNYVSEFGFTMPIDLGAKGSCHIGGNVSTNAGGIRYLRYGSLHGSVLGLEVVLPDGTIINNLSTLRKDSTGYDIKQLFIGAEGTIGVVTGVSILTARKPTSVNVAVLGLNSYEDVRKTFLSSKQHLSEILSAFEFWDSRCMDLTLGHFNMKNPLGDKYPFYALIETSGSNAEHDESKLSSFLELTMENELVMDGALAQDKSQIAKMWTMREGIPESLAKFGSTYKYDISIPIAKLYQIVNDIKVRLSDAGVYDAASEGDSHDEKNIVKSVNGYGHIGDGNLHLNIVANSFNDKLTDLLEPYVYEWVQKVEGSISAEHGLGVMKPADLKYTKGPEMIRTMRVIKNLFDPNEVTVEYWHQVFKPELERAGYVGQMYASMGKNHGIAILGLATRFRIVSSKTVDLGTSTTDSSDFSVPDNVAQFLCLEFIDSEMELGNTTHLKKRKADDDGLPSSVVQQRDDTVAEVYPKVGGKARRLLVANTHLYWKPEAGFERLLQMSSILKAGTEFASDPEVGRWPLILCGDFNTTPDDPLYSLLTLPKPVRLSQDEMDQLLPATLDYSSSEDQDEPPALDQDRDLVQKQKEIEAVYDSDLATVTRLITKFNSEFKEMSFSSCYSKYMQVDSSHGKSPNYDGEPPYTNYTKWKGTLDYILLQKCDDGATTSHLVCKEILLLPPKSALIPGLPNDNFSSDHISIMAKISLSSSSINK